MSAAAKRTYRPETQLVQAGILRSPFGETSEALFLTQGYIYDTAASAVHDVEKEAELRSANGIEVNESPKLSCFNYPFDGLCDERDRQVFCVIGYGLCGSVGQIRRVHAWRKE